MDSRNIPKGFQTKDFSRNLFYSRLHAQIHSDSVEVKHNKITKIKLNARVTQKFLPNTQILLFDWTMKTGVLIFSNDLFDIL